jgi:hypothetical protein
LASYSAGHFPDTKDNIYIFFEQNGRSSAFQLREKEIEFKVHRSKTQTAKQKREIDPGKKTVKTAPMSFPLKKETKRLCY